MGIRFKSELADLKNSFGVELADLTLDEVEDLVHACDRMRNPFSSVNAELVERPVRVVDGVYLWPITAGAQIWLDEFPAEWWGEDSMRYRWAQVYALHHARDPKAFAGLTDKWSAWRAIARTMLLFACHRAELARAVRVAYGDQDWEVEPPAARKLPVKPAVDFAGIVARLEVESGIPRNEWVWGMSFLRMARAYAEMHEYAKALGGQKSAEKLRNELDEAVANLARVKSAIVKRVRAAKDKAAEAGG